MVGDLFSINELDFLLDRGLSLLAGFLIGTGREWKGKPSLEMFNYFLHWHNKRILF
jgi:hypothetical protein